jgi:aspartate kinase
VRDPELSSLLKADTEMECQLLIDYLVAAKRFNLEINSRAKDRVVSFGEKLSCRFMTCLLKDRVRRP